MPETALTKTELGISAGGVQIERVGTCDLCGSSELEPRKRWADYHKFGPDKWTLVQCRNCSLSFINPRPRREAMGAFYGDDYAAHSARSTQPKPWHRRVALRDAPQLSLVGKARVHVRQNLSWYRIPSWIGDGRVLDLGCGSGGRYLDVLQALGWTTHGVEPSEPAVAAAVAKGHRAVVGIAEEQHFPDSSMDLVTIWHVLEHTHSPLRTLSSIFRTLRPGGQLSLCVPNYGSAQAAMWQRFWWSCDAPRHLYQFTWRTLRRYLETAGFRVLHKTTRTGATSWQRTIRHIANAVLGTRYARDSKLFVDLMDPLLGVLSFTRFFGVGSELRVIAERPVS